MTTGARKSLLERQRKLEAELHRLVCEFERETGLAVKKIYPIRPEVNQARSTSDLLVVRTKISLINEIP